MPDGAKHFCQSQPGEIASILLVLTVFIVNFIGVSKLHDLPEDCSLYTVSLCPCVTVSRWPTTKLRLEVVDLPED